MNDYAYRHPWLRMLASAIDAIGGCFYRPRPRMPKEIQRIVFFRLDQIGDAFYATPFLDYLATAYPEATIDIVTTTRNAPVFKHHPALGTIHTYDYPRFARGGHHDDLSTLFALIRKLRTQYDLAIDPRGEPLVAILSTLAAPLRVGLAKEEILSFLYTHPVRYDPTSPAWHRFRRILAALHINAPTWIPSIPLTEDELSAAKTEADHLGPLIGVHLGAGVPFKRWPVAHFAKLARMAKAKGLAVVVFGTKAEQPLADELRAQGVAITDTSGALSLRASYALLAHATAFVGNDSAVVHLAAPHGIPTAHLMSVASPASAAALGSQVHIIRGEDPTHRCPIETCPYPCPHLAAISTEEVAKAIGIY